MKKINNKGMTLIELIISFAIVSVAVIYFAQTLSTVSKLYTKSNKETDEYVEEVYIYRILEAYFRKYAEESITNDYGLAIKHADYAVGFLNFKVFCGDSDLFSKFDKSADIKYKYHQYLGKDFWLLTLFSGCSTLPQSEYIFGLIDTNFDVETKDFKNANIWIPMYYYNIEKTKNVSLATGLFPYSAGMEITGSEAGLEIKNYYNPSLKLFVSHARKGEKIYQYVTYFNYEKYTKPISEGGFGKKVHYVVDNSKFETFIDTITEKAKEWVEDVVDGVEDLIDNIFDFIFK